MEHALSQTSVYGLEDCERKSDTIHFLKCGTSHNPEGAQEHGNDSDGPVSSTRASCAIQLRPRKMTELDDCRRRAPKNNDTNKWYHVLAKDATRLDLNFEEGKLYLASVQNFPQNPILRIVCAPLAQSQSHLT